VGGSAGSAGAVRPGVPKLLVWDNTPPHHTDTAAAGGIEIAWLSFRSPELNPCEDLWRRLKAVVAADRCYAAVDEPADRATAWLDHLAPDDVRRRGGYREHARAGASG
jgi:transposase